MPYKYGKRTQAFFIFISFSFLYFGGVYNKTMIPRDLVGDKMIKANTPLSSSLAI